VAFDAQSAWVELGAYVASKPNHGRQDLLAAMARIAAEHSIPEEEFQRALRLTLPAFAELLFDRTARTRALGDPETDVSGGAGLSASLREPGRPTIAA
jgi:hypothetical protein